MWRVAQPVDGDFSGGFLPWRNIGTMFDVTKATYHDKADAPYIWNPDSKVFFGFENEKSIQAKVNFGHFNIASLHSIRIIQSGYL